MGDSYLYSQVMWLVQKFGLRAMLGALSLWCRSRAMQSGSRDHERCWSAIADQFSLLQYESQVLGLEDSEPLFDPSVTQRVSIQ